MTTTTPVRALLIASTFAPVNGGSAVVYDSLCRELPAGSVRVLSARINYLDNREIAGWREHDAQAPYPVERIGLLRPPMLAPPRNLAVSLWRLLAQDLALYWKAYREAARLVAQYHINTIVVGELVTGSWLGLALRARFGCRVVIYVHGEEVTTVTGGRLHGNLRATYLRAADHVVAVSAFTCDALERLMHVRRDHITLVPNGVDTARFVPAPPSPELVARHQLAGKKVVLTVGRLVTRKGVDMALRAVALVLRTTPTLHYLIAGDGPERPRLEQIIEEEGLARHVTLLGKVSNEDLLRYLQLCDVFLMPNRTLDDGDTEGFGLVFREANACGKPVIGGRAGGVVEAVVDGETGLLVDGTDVDDIARALQSILGDRALAAHWGAQGLALARANNTRAVAAKFLQVCERLLAHQSAPAVQRFS
jgi:glycosyltransferase involved in cell wall biosynthesis